MVAQALEVPFLVRYLGRQETLHVRFDSLLDHADHLLADILAVEHLVTLGVNDLTLAVENVVVL